jgi:pimeloyl-ACP methyl ester carboxylesterase
LHIDPLLFPHGSHTGADIDTDLLSTSLGRGCGDLRPSRRLEELQQRGRNEPRPRRINVPIPLSVLPVGKKTLRGYQRGLFGGAPEDVPEATRASSPITYADQVRAPVLVIQGSNDTRCPARQMRGYEDKMKSLGKNIKIEWFDAGHGSRAQEQDIQHQEMMLRFAYQVLG